MRVIIFFLLLSLSFSQVLIWSDNMDNFPQNWTCGGVGDTWTKVSNRYHSSPYSVKGSKDSLYRNNVNIWMERSVNLANFYNGAVTFYIYQDLDTNDYIYFEYLVGDSWVTFWQANGSVGGFYQRVMSPIPNTATKIRFRLATDDSIVREGVYIDDVSVYGYRYDVGVTEIIAPKGIIDSGTTITPKAKVKNFGDILIPTCTVRMRIGTFYNNIQLVSNLSPGQEKTVNFANWQVRQRGTWVVNCSAYLRNDYNPNNNRKIETIFVRVRDVGVVSILSPTGIVDSGATCLPQAKIKNYGNTVESLGVIFKIGSNYRDSLFLTLFGNKETTLSFASWLANQRGKHNVKCSLLINDFIPTNNYKGDSVFVRVFDVGIKEILQPTGMVDSGLVVNPLAKIKNYGNVNANFKSYFKIGNSYLDSLALNIPADKETIIAFSQWLANLRGKHLVKCTLLINDWFLENNRLIDSVFVRVLDVGVVEILSPKGIIDSGTTCLPQAKIKNYGNVDKEFPVLFKIGNHYQDTIFLFLNPEKETLLSFSQWSALIRGNHLVSCSLLTNDQRPDNNYQVDSVFVRVLDVGFIEIITPKGNIDSTGFLTPQGKIKNYGNSVVSLLARIRITGDSYYWEVDTVVDALLPNEQRIIAFPLWQIQKRGEYNVSCSTALISDQVPDNNKLSENFYIKVPDCGIITIYSPPEECDSNQVYPVSALVKNYGTDNEYFKIAFKIGDEYYSYRYLNLAPLETLTVLFDSWQPQRRDYVCSYCVIDSIGKDINPANDTVRSTHFVKVLDVGILRIISPSDSVSQGEITPKIEVKNFGNVFANFLLRAAIYKNSLLVYSDSVFLTLSPYEIRIVSFASWQATEGDFRIVISLELNGDMTPENNILSKNFIVQSYEPWLLLRDIPRGSYKGVKNGAALAFGNNKVFAFKGNNTREFYSYSYATNSWEERKPLPAGDKGKNVKDGGGLAFVNTYNLLFAIKGNKTKEFYVYYPELDSWERKKDIPGKKGASGGSGLIALSLANDTNYIILLKGNTKELYCYFVEKDSWLFLKELPGEKKFKKGSALTTDNRYLYILKGKTNEFFVYDIRKDSVEKKKDLPFIGRSLRKKKAKDGAALACDGERVYAFKGGNCDEFWVYDIGNDEWFELEPIPLLPSNKKVKGGGALCYDPINKIVYAFKGSNTYEFWRYLPKKTFLAKGKPKSSLNLEKSNTIFKKPPEIRIYNLLGNLIYHQKGNCQIPKLRKGIYLLRLKYEGYELNKKIFIIKD
jgi:hypothetical protein